MKCGGALWGLERTHKHATRTPAPPASPLATAAVLREAAVPLADQILSVTFPLINGHLLPPFSLHGYTLSLCSSNHLIVMTFNPAELICLGARLCSTAWLHLLPAYLPATYQLGRCEGTQTNKSSRQRSYGRQIPRFCLLQWLLFLPTSDRIYLFSKAITAEEKTETYRLMTSSLFLGSTALRLNYRHET